VFKLCAEHGAGSEWGESVQLGPEYTKSKIERERWKILYKQQANALNEKQLYSDLLFQ
jgi:hypothetical protein